MRSEIADDKTILNALDRFMSKKPTTEDIVLLASLYAEVALAPQGVDAKYGAVWTENKRFHPGEPVFIIRGTDARAARAVANYADDCENISPPEHVKACREVAKNIVAWQKKNPKLVKLPD